jgi:hypothetical protein
MRNVQNASEKLARFITFQFPEKLKIMTMGCYLHPLFFHFEEICSGCTGRLPAATLASVVKAKIYAHALCPV